MFSCARHPISIQAFLIEFCIENLLQEKRETIPEDFNFGGDRLKAGRKNFWADSFASLFFLTWKRKKQQIQVKLFSTWLVKANFKTSFCDS